MKKLLVVVDYQNDFVNGSLGFKGAEKLEEGILFAVEQTLSQGGYVLFTRDTHPKSYLETREGRYLPLPHCIEGTQGHQLYGKLHLYETTPVPNTLITNKPTFGYSAIAQEARQLCNGAPDVIEICGLVTDICVVSNAILLHSAFLEADIRILVSLCGSGNTENAKAALAVLKGMGFSLNNQPS